MDTGVVQVYYGEGHGKSTAAIGFAVSAACEGKESVVIQFLKGKCSRNQELMSRLEPELKFFNFSRAEIFFNDLDEDSKQEEIMNIRNGFNYAKKVVSTKTDGTVVLDELLGLWDLNLITIAEIKELLELKNPEVTIIMTGKVFPDEIKESVDEIYRIVSEK